jgi:hypothetical protein
MYLFVIEVSLSLNLFLTTMTYLNVSIVQLLVLLSLILILSWPICEPIELFLRLVPKIRLISNILDKSMNLNLRIELRLVKCGMIIENTDIFHERNPIVMTCNTSKIIRIYSFVWYQDKGSLSIGYFGKIRLLFYPFMTNLII